ncbi:unnamed protein product [Parascedosporium putredinis]|uniref:RING-type E3 ubiquitin transferase n=1 Tax=Parascedosporium putredinis TaxID=1442378 RepID=A0A9P1GUG5_9PEZI|nr:unnamed protein product [Parascedosporium putredinis]CAI7987323.1 unnamed protein product [Parascedosporium putredinis]
MQARTNEFAEPEYVPELNQPLPPRLLPPIAPACVYRKPGPLDHARRVLSSGQPGTESLAHPVPSGSPALDANAEDSASDTATPPLQRRESRSRLLPLIFIFACWLIFFPDNPSDLIAAPELAASRLRHQLDALDVLNSTKWGDFAPQQPLLPLRMEMASSPHIPPVDGRDLWLDGRAEPVWQNASGRVHGPWSRRDASVKRLATSYNLTAVTPGIEWSAPDLPWGRNATGSQGQMKMRIRDKANLDARDGFDADPIYGAGAVRAEITIEDTDGSGRTWDMRLHGVHWKRQGALLLTTTSEKFDGIFALPHLVPSPRFFESSRALLNRTIADRLRQSARYLSFDARIPWTSDIDDVDIYAPNPNCEYVMYAQIMPLDRAKLDLSHLDPENESISTIILDIERELTHPLGAPIRGVPPLQLAAVVFSPDCAFFLDSKGPPAYPQADGHHLLGMKAEIYRSTLNTCLLIYALLFAGQVLLLKQQIRETCTPSTMGRVSFYTGVIMLTADFLVVTAVTAFLLSSESSLQSLTLMFAAFISMFVGGTFLFQIFEVQQQEWVRRATREAAVAARNTGAGTPAPTTNANTTMDAKPSPSNNSDSESDPDPTERDRLLSPPAQASGERRICRANSHHRHGRPFPASVPSFSSVVARIALAASCLFFLLVASTTWPPAARSTLANFAAFSYLSLWLPQIIRNVRRNCRRALSWRFTAGQSVLRLVPLAYLYCRPDNILLVRTDARAFAALAGWVWLQLCILAAQDLLGPRFGLPASWTPDAWDYHPVLREDSLEAANKLPLALAESAPAPGDPPGVRSVDCAICREVLHLPVLPSATTAATPSSTSSPSSPKPTLSSSSFAAAAAQSVPLSDDTTAAVAAVLGTSGYMVTPCRHVFHSPCLEGWMRFRLQCPICREDLPPL